MKRESKAGRTSDKPLTKPDKAGQTWAEHSPYTWPRRLREVAQMTEDSLAGHTEGGRTYLEGRVAALRSQADQFEVEHPYVPENPQEDYTGVRFSAWNAVS